LNRENLIFVLYLLLGPATWCLFAFAMFAGRKRMMLVKRPRRELPVPPPRVTILIPAKDEGERIRDCIESALAQDYPNFRVIAVDDRSTDQTGTIMDSLAAEHTGRLQVVHIPHDSLPAGWTGKCNALFTAVKQAQGDWLLFVDSDVILQPDALSSTLALAAAKNYHLVSLLPKLETHGFWENLIIPLAGAGLSMMYLVALTNANNHSTAFANGQFILIRRDAYDSFGGHAAVKDKFCEDIEMARIVKGKGLRPRITWGTELAAVRMYSSLPSIFRGWGRIFFAGSRGRPWRIIAGILFILVCAFSCYAALAWGIFRVLHPAELGNWPWLAASGFHLALMSILIGIMYAWSGNPRRTALLFPLGGVMLIGLFIQALKLCATGNVIWRGTQYARANP
jgi:cellulose synthase/poly-beta-1,6-N-acetylglucosamine synthase-like glycosyltransferase